MSDRDEIPIEGDASTSRFHIPQVNRDLQSNWEVDLAKSLEEYLLKICSGEISSERECSINFAEAALLVQGSVQVYSRKVEYLHSLVLAALEFLSQKRQDQQETTSEQPDGSKSNAVVEDDNEVFLGLDDVPVDPKNCLDHGLDKEDNPNSFLKPPANLLVLEGDCLDSSGDASELESYLLSTCNFYKDFLLLDPCDAGAIFSYLKSTGLDQEQPPLQKGSSIRSKHHENNFLSPTRQAGVTPRKSSIGKKQGVTLDGNSESNNVVEPNNDNTWSAPLFEHDIHEEPQFEVSNNGDDTDSDNDNPWKPLNPHEPGNLKIKPFQAIKSFGRRVIRNSKRNTVASQFPIAKLDGIISPELAEVFEVQLRLQERQNANQSPPYFEKLRRSFMDAAAVAFDAYGGIDHNNDDNGLDDFPDFEHDDFDLPNNTYDMNTELSANRDKDGAANFDGVEAFSQDDLGSQASLEDLCRSHLDALLASIAETEKQTELAARVSTWKQRIEQNLEEQDSHPPFDIHQYGDMVLDRLSLVADSGGIMSFTDVVKGQPKHDIARTFSALLQLVNNGDVDLQKAPPSRELICYTSKNPFHVRLLRANKKRQELKINSARKRAKSPKNKSSKTSLCNSDAMSPSKTSNQIVKSPTKLGKDTAIHCTPEGKRRRRSRLAETIDIQHAG